LLGETIDELVKRPYRKDLERIVAETEKLRDGLQRALAKRDVDALNRIHREIAGLYPRVKQISTTLARAKRRTEPYSPDFTESARIEDLLDALMTECAVAIVSRRR
jgi:hypothetical protein